MGIVTEAWNSFKRKPKYANFIPVIETQFWKLLWKGREKMNREVEILTRSCVSP